MASGLKLIDWDDITEAAPAVVTALMMPLTFSIANGIAMGFITYAAIKALSGRWSDLNTRVVVIAIVFVLQVILLASADGVLVGALLASLAFIFLAYLVLRLPAPF